MVLLLRLDLIHLEEVSLSLRSSGLGLGKRSRQCRDDVNVIGDTAHARGFAAQIPTHRRQISVHARPYGGIEPGLAILRAKVTSMMTLLSDCGMAQQ